MTPMQLAYANAILASQGRTFVPHVVQSMSYPGQSIDAEKTPYISTAPLTFNHWRYVISAMEKVIEYGTGSRFGSLKHPFASKTGTAQLVKNSGRTHRIKTLSDHSWFMGFFVKDSPDFAITVLVENDNDAITTTSMLI